MPHLLPAAAGATSVCGVFFGHARASYLLQDFLHTLPVDNFLELSTMSTALSTAFAAPSPDFLPVFPIYPQALPFFHSISAQVDKAVDISNITNILQDCNNFYEFSYISVINIAQEKPAFGTKQACLWQTGCITLAPYMP